MSISRHLRCMNAIVYWQAKVGERKLWRNLSPDCTRLFAMKNLAVAIARKSGVPEAQIDTAIEYGKEIGGRYGIERGTLAAIVAYGE